MRFRNLLMSKLFTYSKLTLNSIFRLSCGHARFEGLPVHEGPHCLQSGDDG